MPHRNLLHRLEGATREGRLRALNTDHKHIITAVSGRNNSGFLLTRRGPNGELSTRYHLRDHEGNIRDGKVEEQASKQPGGLQN